MSTPKLFVSYSWTTPEHEEWVLKLASDLRQDGVDVVLDKWDLKEGHDAHAFMEQMVTDSALEKVILVCDKMYAEKANSRRGGVGAEAQIISPDLYNKQSQTKFCAVVVERDNNGSPFLPAYYKSRIYIDLSDSAIYSENYDKLLRWIFDRPIHEKPLLGKPPAFLADEGSAVQLGTTTRFRRSLEAIRSGRPNAPGLTSEYLDTLAEELKRLRIDPKPGGFQTRFLASLQVFTGIRNQYIEIVRALSRNSNFIDYAPMLHIYGAHFPIGICAPRHKQL